MWCNLLFCLNNFYGSLPGLKKKNIVLFVYWAIFRFINSFKGSPCLFILWSALTPEPFAPVSWGAVCWGWGEWFFSGETVFRLEKLRWREKHFSWWTITLPPPPFEKDTVLVTMFRRQDQHRDPTERLRSGAFALRTPFTNSLWVSSLVSY